MSHFNLKMGVAEWKNAQWYEYTAPATLEQEGSLSDIPADISYKQFVDEDGTVFPLPGMRANGQEIAVESSTDYDVKDDDVIEFPNGKKYTVRNVSTIHDTSNAMALFNFPGAEREYTRILITFK